MRLRRGALAAGLLALACGSALQAAELPATPPLVLQAPLPVQDDRGRSVQLVRAPERIVSLLPSLTETVCALQQCHRLVGVDRYSNWPAQVRQLPVVGGGLDPNVEAIVALKPDLVLMSKAARVGERLQALGVPVVALEPRTEADVRRVLGSVGRLLGVPQEQGADRLWQSIAAGVDAAAHALPAGVQGGRVYFEVSRGPYAAGPSSFIGELLTRLGMANVVPADLGPFPRLNPEFVLRAQPDVILMGNHSMQLAQSYPGWNQLKAVREGRVCGFNAQDSDTVVRPGPRMDEAARIIVQCLRDKAPRR